MRTGFFFLPPDQRSKSFDCFEYFLRKESKESASKESKEPRTATLFNFHSR